MYEFKLTKDQEKKAIDLHEKAIVIDGLIPKGGMGLNYPKDRERLLAGGITAMNCTIAHFPENFSRAVKEVDRHKEAIFKSDYLSFADSVEDIRKAKRERRVAAIIGFQDGNPIEDDLAHLRAFKALGVRIIQMTYNTANLIGVGCAERFYGGLTHFGVEVVKEMNRLGIVMELSHCCDETTMDAIQLSKDPVLFTHCGTRALCNAYGRNKTDEQIKALAEKGGVIGIGWLPMCVKQDPETHEVQNSTVEDVLNHIDHVVELVGVDHVGFGTDTDGRILDQRTIRGILAYECGDH